MEIWQILANAGVTGSTLGLVFLLYIFIKSRKDNAHKNKASNTNTIHVGSQKEDNSSYLLKEDIKETRELIKDLSKNVNTISTELTKLQIAMAYYVDNNGVKPEVKVAFKEILKGGKE